MVKLGPGGKDLPVEMGYSMDRIMYFESQKSPVESLLKHCSETCSVEELFNKLHAIGRVDAIDTIDVSGLSHKTVKWTLCCIGPTFLSQFLFCLV